MAIISRKTRKPAARAARAQEPTAFSQEPAAFSPEPAPVVVEVAMAPPQEAEAELAPAEANTAQGAPEMGREAASAVEASFGAARDGVIALNMKALEALKAEAEANFAMLTSLAGAKSMLELVTLQTEFARKRFEDGSARARELAELARKVADDTTAAMKAHVAKTFRIAV